MPTMATSLPAAGGGSRASAVCAAVDKIEEKRKPEDFIGHRNRRSEATQIRNLRMQFATIQPRWSV